MPSPKMKNTASPAIGPKTGGNPSLLANTPNYDELIRGQQKAISAADDFICRTCSNPLTEKEYDFGWKLCFTCHPLPKNPERALAWDVVWRFFISTKLEG